MRSLGLWVRGTNPDCPRPYEVSKTMRHEHDSSRSFFWRGASCLGGILELVCPSRYCVFASVEPAWPISRRTSMEKEKSGLLEFGEMVQLIGL
jgi:hypothetical protein